MNKIMGSGPDCVLLHGWAFDNLVWGLIAERLANRYRVHLLDLPGFGSHSTMMLADSAPACVEQLLPFLPKKAVYVGWSLGGLLALQLAIDYPSRVEQVITLGSSPCFLTQPNWQGVSQDYFKRFYQAVNDNPSKALRQFVLLTLADRQSQKHYFAYALSRLSKLGATNLLRGLDILEKTDLRLQNSVETLALIGENDPLTPLNSSRKAVVIPGAGHLLPMTHASVVAHHIEEVLACTHTIN